MSSRIAVLACALVYAVISGATDSQCGGKRMSLPPDQNAVVQATATGHDRFHAELLRIAHMDAETIRLLGTEPLLPVFWLDSGDPEAADLISPVLYEQEHDRILVCPDCFEAEDRFHPWFLATLYLQALYARSTADIERRASASNDAEVMQAMALRDADGYLLIGRIIDRASGGMFLPMVRETLASKTLSEPVTPHSIWRVPNDQGWERIDAAWPDEPLGSTEQGVRDDVIRLLSGALQGISPDERADAFLSVLAAFDDGC